MLSCRSNYDKKNEVSTFKFPTDNIQRDQRIKAVKRNEFTPTTYSSVCVKHFTERFLIRENKLIRNDGTVIVTHRCQPGLTNDA